jgi:GDP-L-fucose synthase
MPTNLYGPGDNYHPEHSHVPAALIHRLHEAKIAGAPTVTVWGTGRPRREFLAVDDLADACVFVLKDYSGSKFLNVGLDGTPQKLLNVSELTRLGWRAKTPLREGIAAAYSDFIASGDGRSRIRLREA